MRHGGTAGRINGWGLREETGAVPTTKNVVIAQQVQEQLEGNAQMHDGTEKWWVQPCRCAYKGLAVSLIDGDGRGGCGRMGASPSPFSARP